MCHAAPTRRRDLQFRREAELRKTVHVCRRCGYVAIDEISADRYRGATSLDDIPHTGSARVGTAERPGREFQLARMALDILDRKKPVDVLVYGAGHSMDNLHIQRLPGVRETSIADIMQVRDDAPFVDANNPGRRRFPVVVSSEVVEHFRDPLVDFGRLFGLVGPRGLLACGTSLRDDTRPLRRQRYLFYPDHTSLYTPEALQVIAAEHGFQVDFRTGFGLGPLKRYLLFTRSAEVRDRVTAYFGRHDHGPSELGPDPLPGPVPAGAQ